MDDVPEPAAIFPELLRNLDSRACQKEEEERGELAEARAEDRAMEVEEGVLAIVPPPPIEIESSILQPPPKYSPPSYYIDELSNQYARANIWGKTEIHLQLLDQETRRLDTLNFQIHSRIEKIKEEAAAVRAEIALARQKHQVLHNLYKQHGEELESLEEERANLESEEQKHMAGRQPSQAAHSRKRTASVAGGFRDGRSKSRKVVGPGRLQNSIARENVARGKQSDPITPPNPPNPYAMTSEEVGILPQVCNYISLPISLWFSFYEFQRECPEMITPV